MFGTVGRQGRLEGLPDQVSDDIPPVSGYMLFVAASGEKNYFESEPNLLSAKRSQAAKQRHSLHFGLPVSIAGYQTGCFLDTFFSPDG